MDEICLGRLDPPVMYKNRLQEYTQRSAIPQPLYQTMSEGPPNARRFRSTVEVDGATYTSPNSFLHKKAAEQDVAKIALEHISKRIRDEGCPLIHEVCYIMIFFMLVCVKDYFHL